MPSRRVSYYYDSAVPNHHYGPGHPMKPQRLRLTHELVLSYGLFRRMDMLKSRKAQPAELTRYHEPSYIQFLSEVHKHSGTAGYGTDSLNAEIDTKAGNYNVGEQTDCPIFDGLYEFCQTTCGASIDGAARLNSGEADICINWSGGLHHAKKGEASGFCYANDIVLSILELLRIHARVLYIDIDIHHGDGVEEAFYYSNRVMTCSFHKFGDFFPGTGDLNDIGGDEGTGYTVNFPVKDGLDDRAFEFCFKPIIQKIMDVFDPGAVVLQCGADSLAGDRLGLFDLSIKGHAACVEFVKSFNRPLLVLGGGGYTINNVARCWAYETAVLLDENLPDQIPKRDRFYEFYAPTYTIHGVSLERSQVPPGTSKPGITGRGLGDPAMPVRSSMVSELGGDQAQAYMNYLTACRDIILSRLDELRGAPAVALQEVPASWAAKCFEVASHIDVSESEKPSNNDVDMDD